MTHVTIICDREREAEDIGRALAGFCDAAVLAPAALARVPVPERSVIAIDLDDHACAAHLRDWLKRRSPKRRAVFVVDRGVRRQAVQAHALGATDAIERPVTRGALLQALFRDGGERALAGEQSACRSDGCARAADAGSAALHDMFAAACAGGTVALDLVDSAGTSIVSNIEVEGLAPWIATVRQHHSQTYQHCLLVTGIAAAFACDLGFSKADRRKLAFGGLLHDIGKAKIAIEILEKPGPLDSAELLVMRQHPLLGLDALSSAEGLDPDMLDVVVHHHEYLDGSGYPHGLGGSDLTDLVRMMTIADVFGALMERRSYKPPLSAEAALEILEKMGPKLDRDLVRAFGRVARTSARAEPDARR